MIGQNNYLNERRAYKKFKFHFLNKNIRKFSINVNNTKN